MMRRALSAAVLAAFALGAPSATAASAPTTGVTLADGHGIQILHQTRLGPRQVDAELKTKALQHPVDVRILVPLSYAAHPDRRYPVLYLFHGTSGRPSDWVKVGDAQKTTRGLPMILVLPDAGFNGDGGGWCTNWYNGGAHGQPEWETFHIDQFIPWIDSNLRTIPHRRGRAIAGLSQGGFCSLSYAARHPDMFTSVAGFSGAAEIDRDPEAIALVTPVIQATASGLDGAGADDMFGPRATQELNWQAHDPGTLSTNLRGMQIQLWTGNGQPGPLDSGEPNLAAQALESGVFQLNELFHGHLVDEGIPSAYHYYGNGTHTWPYWARDLREYVGPLMNRFAHPPGRPRTVTYRTVSNPWSQWGWRVAVRRPVPAFSRLSRANAHGFTLTGTHDATVKTPRSYVPGATVVVGESGPAGDETRHVTADGRGQLRIPVPLSGDATSATTRVTIKPLSG
jgi:S-formylglutathione hydrolase FrmB